MGTECVDKLGRVWTWLLQRPFCVGNGFPLRARGCTKCRTVQAKKRWQKTSFDSAMCRGKQTARRPVRPPPWNWTSDTCHQNGWLEPFHARHPTCPRWVMSWCTSARVTSFTCRPWRNTSPTNWAPISVCRGIKTHSSGYARKDQNESWMRGKSYVVWKNIHSCVMKVGGIMNDSDLGEYGGGDLKQCMWMSIIRGCVDL